jgi:hypothetical protein
VEVDFCCPLHEITKKSRRMREKITIFAKGGTDGFGGVFGDITK